ncbi:MAG: polysaccharide deacetylase family protein [Desulfovibrio sp.]|nr:polysaccharide deacetylase family protein [Desulfovibrio sp.]
MCGLLALGLLATGSGQAQAEPTPVYGGTSISNQPMGENLCAITFDDGPSIFTPHLLDMLDYYGISATFFQLGKNAAYYPDIVKRVLAEGHEVGSHSYSHPNMRKLSYQAKEEQLARTDQILRSLGAEPVIMRPPYGNSDVALQELCDKFGYRIIIWSLDSLDWKRLPADYSQLRNEEGYPWPKGKLHGIFLFHDIHKRTVDDLPRIVSQLKEGGCQRFVTVSEYMHSELFMDPEPGELMTRHPVRHGATLQAQAPQAPQPAAPSTAEPQVAQPAETPAVQTAQAGEAVPAQTVQTSQAPQSQTAETPAVQTAQTPAAPRDEIQTAQAVQTDPSPQPAEPRLLPAAPSASARPAWRQPRAWGGFAKDAVAVASVSQPKTSPAPQTPADLPALESPAPAPAVQDAPAASDPAAPQTPAQPAAPEAAGPAAQ